MYILKKSWYILLLKQIFIESTDAVNHNDDFIILLAWKWKLEIRNWVLLKILRLLEQSLATN